MMVPTGSSAASGRRAARGVMMRLSGENERRRDGMGGRGGNETEEVGENAGELGDMLCCLC